MSKVPHPLSTPLQLPFWEFLLSIPNTQYYSYNPVYYGLWGDIPSIIDPYLPCHKAGSRSPFNRSGRIA